MASIGNKLLNNVTNATSGFFGREGMTKLSNSLNRAFTSKSKYRDYLQSGNVVQFLSRSSQCAVQICSVEGQPAMLYVNGKGLVGTEYVNSQFKLLLNPRNGHYTFSNQSNYLCIDMLTFLPSIKPEPPKKKKKAVKIPIEFEFRLHEIFGSDEFFALEFVGRPGHYLAVLPDGIVQTTVDKTDKNSHLSMNLVFKFTQFVGLVPHQPEQSITATAAASLPNVTSTVSIASTSSSLSSAASSTLTAADAKRAEAQAQAQPTNSQLNNLPEPAAASAGAQSLAQAPFQLASCDTPPEYQSLYPTLPK